MGKRSEFKRVERDYYPTPKKAVIPLLHMLPPCVFTEPCAGDGRLVKHLTEEGFICEGKFDIEPQCESVSNYDALKAFSSDGVIITNPPWNRKILHPMIMHFKDIADTWLLFDADWAYTKQSYTYMKYCAEIVPVGRVSWLENGISGKDNCAWYLFKKQEQPFTKLHKVIPKINKGDDK